MSLERIMDCLKKLASTLLLLFPSSVFAQSNLDIVLPSTHVHSRQVDIDQEAKVWSGKVLTNLDLDNKSSIADTLTSITGVSNSSFGPVVGRPVVRGMDGERIKILQNGLVNLDVSSLSADHGVSIDPLIVEKIELIRGPAALMYGEGVVGGVVNAIDYRIHKEPFTGISGKAESRYDSVNQGKSNVALVDFGFSSLIFHIDAYNRSTGNLSIPNYAESKYLMNNKAPQSKGVLLNSGSNSYGGAIGVSMIFDNAYAGISFSNHNLNYGSPKEETVRLDMQSNRLEFNAEVKELPGPLNSIKIKLSNTDYKHNEIESNIINTSFSNKGVIGSLEATHKDFHGFNGLLGIFSENSRFSSIGNEAFAPNAQTNAQAIYIFEKFNLAEHKISFALRRGEHQIDSIEQKTFSTHNVSVGDEYNLNEMWTVKASLNHLERAPSYYELFSNGIHAAVGQYIVGNSSIKREKSNGLDLYLKRTSVANVTSFKAYYNYFNSYIGLFNTGNLINIDSEYWNENMYKSVKASFKGFELESKQFITDNLNANLRSEYVIAINEDANVYLPRIAPLKISLGATYQKERYSFNLNALHGFPQNKLAYNELKTDAYTNLSAWATYQVLVPHNIEFYVKANNLLNHEIREATSYIKDIAPQGGRSIMVGLLWNF